MHPQHSSALLSFLVAATSTLVRCQTIIPSPDIDKGWCYFCSDYNAPPLCNSQCLAAIDRLCHHGDLHEALTDTEQNCQVKYMPPVWPMSRNGARPAGVTPQQCLDTFTNVLNMCGKDAGTPEPNPPNINTSYCTTSGGGGNYGWLDTGEIMNNPEGRYIITSAIDANTPTNQCGQSEASWKQNTTVIQWDDSWVQPGDQVILDTNPPPLTGAALAAATAIPAPNPECDTEVCDIYDNPYYAHSPVAPWADANDPKNFLRHRIVYEGWSKDAGSPRLLQALRDRCGVEIHNWKAYKNDTGPQLIADISLTTHRGDHCWCIPDAVYDASVGIVMPRNSFCGSYPLTDLQGNAEFVPVL
jgi:hypothetical protein